MNYKYIFGPVISRRFGISLGVDLSYKTKQCNFDCLYCELQSFQKIQTQTEITDFIDIKKELKHALKKFNNIDVITLTANGEPTLYPYLEKVVDYINSIKQEKPLLILSNSSTITNKAMQHILSKIDIVKLSLDSAIEKEFKKLDRPLKSIKLDNIINSIIEFRKNFNNKLIIEILFVKGINDNKKSIKELIRVLKKINPNRIDIGTIDRPPAYQVKQISNKKLIKIANMFQGFAINIATRKQPTKKIKLKTNKILPTISKRPLSLEEIKTLYTKKSYKKILKLVDNKTLQIVDVANIKFVQFKKLC